MKEFERKDYAYSGLASIVAGSAPLIVAASLLFNSMAFCLKMHYWRDYKETKTVAARLVDLNGNHDGQTSEKEWQYALSTKDPSYSRLKAYIKANMAQIPRL